CEGILDGKVKAFISLGGNFVRAVPDTERMEAAWRGLDLSVQVATKLNRNHLITGKTSYILPCLVRTEIDEQASGKQIVTVEDSTTCIHASRGVATPASKHLKSEPAIIAGIANATLAPNPNVPWDDWVADYGLVRNAIATTYPEAFHDFNDRLDTPGGFPRPIGARDRKWETESGKANFLLPKALHSTFDDGMQPDILRLMTIRSNDQFNTTIYGYDDRLRGISGSRMIVMMNRQDMERLGLKTDDTVRLETAVNDGIARSVEGLRVLEYNVPRGCLAAYYPETNPLIPLYQHAEESMTPAAKSVPVRVCPVS
ncbi:MAG: molybdopterin dinucleotide binding domain-containing protein, partial [Aliihoeflea sp.]